MKILIQRLLVAGVLVAGGLLFSVTLVSAHRDGCHRWHSCPSDTGSYVCGDLGYYSECPNKSTPQTPTIPSRRIPVISKKTIISDESIAYQSRVRKTGKEYVGFRKITQAGVAGIKRNYIEVTYTDNVETGRVTKKTEIVAKPITKVTVIGKRIKPVANISGIVATKKKNKYDIKGKYKPNREVVLAVNGKKIKRAKTDKHGKYVFKGIKITQQNANLKLYERKNRKEKQISEKTFVDSKKKKLITEYKKMHQ